MNLKSLPDLSFIDNLKFKKLLISVIDKSTKVYKSFDDFRRDLFLFFKRTTGINCYYFEV